MKHFKTINPPPPNPAPPYPPIKKKILPCSEVLKYCRQIFWLKLLKLLLYTA